MNRKLIYTFILFIYLLNKLSLSQTTDTSFPVYEQTIPGSSLKFKMVPIKGGSFTMGSPENEKGRDTDEGPQKKFIISPFWMGAFEVTHDEFDIFFKDANTSQNSKRMQSQDQVRNILILAGIWVVKVASR